ncbi:E3 ubiquitin-protein ligase TTC3-like isoform X2 [Xyrauchen texanus]|uniref:E3 ubiquitin-protein ligase TTC3-like isoform X2 n=1 Tax=Xyrauchen texanus TaxID=154827 RepID=UPI002241F0CD|nr:E3 ubiquitin-protein ligase TTC3-like isoform X2 [Xyrauchen texanus]
MFFSLALQFTRAFMSRSRNQETIKHIKRRFSHNSMTDTEDSDLEEGPDIMRHKTKIVYQSQFPYIHMEPPDVIYEKWTKIKPEVKKQVGHMMHVSVFWWPILLRQQDNHPTTFWAVEMGFLDSNVSNDLSLKRLQKIEILESILEAMERRLSHRDMTAQARDVVALNRYFTMQDDCLLEAIHWLEDSGVPLISKKLLELGSVEIRYRTLSFVFSEYARYLQVMSCSKKKAIEELRLEPDAWTISKSEEMKNKGNEQFQKRKYDLALKCYTKAIKYHPSNHLLYGNRALCFLRSEKYLKALGDGKRAVILQPDWAKGHYRFCDALFCLGEHQKALEANRLALSVCTADTEGQKDLQQQFERFHAELQESRAEGKSKKMESKKTSNKSRVHAAGDSSGRPSEAASQSSVLENPQECENRKDRHEVTGNSPAAQTHAEEAPDRHKDMKSEMTPRKIKRAVSSTPDKPCVRSKVPPAAERRVTAAVVSDAGLRERFCTAVQDGHAALSDQRCRNAQQSFSLALSILDSSGTTELGFSELDRCVLIYGYATALLEIGQPEELAEAQRLFTTLETSERKFQSLMHYGMGRVYLKENRFAKALEQFSNALLMIQRHITPGKLTWPTTKAIVEETQPSYLQEHLETFIEICTFPPKADAICRHQHCRSHSVEIYFSDPDFKGFIQMSCCQSCKVEFHISCWKKLKTVSFTDKNEKDFLKDLCFTPDCRGQICHIVIFGPTGLVKCEFETSIPKIRPTGRMRIKQPCTSIKKLKSKTDRKLRRKQQKSAARVAHAEIKEVTPAAEDQTTATHTDSIYVDQVLHQIHENKELFKEECVNISCVLERLRPWLDLYESKGHESVLNSRCDARVLTELVDLLLESQNRVWARVFIETLGSSLHIKHKLQHWAQRLDKAGLTAAESFISRHCSHLDELDVSPLLAFAPLQETLLEKFGTVQELFDGGGFTVMEYLRQAPAKEKRLFIWTLESNREHYHSCHFILHQYFEDDAVCLVLKKTDDDEHINTVFKSKNRHRKKNKKESKSVILLSGVRAGHSRDEDDDEDDLFSEEDSLMFLSGADPFSVPDHLRGQLAEFEQQYAGSAAYRNRYERILDNNPDPTKESLYDYFAQILEEHGPLCASDPLMVGELENFPTEAQQKIADAGGLNPFLLESLRFVMTDDLIGLMKHAVSLTDSSVNPFNTRLASHLNPSAKEFWPQIDVLTDGESQYNNDNKDDSDLFLLLPDPYPCDDVIAVDAAAQAEALQLYETVGDPPVHRSDSDTECSAGVTHTADKHTADKHTSVQAFNSKDVSINTEPYVSFEINNGDMTQKEKENIELLKKIEQMKDDHDITQQTRREQIKELQEEIENLTHRSQIAGTELTMFQHKLEEEVKKDQQEKRENQETLKTLKTEIKDLTDLQDSLTKVIHEKNKEYQTELDRFLDDSNQCAAERMSLEDEIKRHRFACARHLRRSVTAQLSVLQSRRDQVLRPLRSCVSEGKMIVKHLTEASLSSSALLLSVINDWKRFVGDAEDKINRTEMEFDKQMIEVKKGTRLCSLPLISAPPIPTKPAVPLPVPPQSGSQFTQQASGCSTPAERTPPEESVSRAASHQHASAPQHVTVYDRILERLNMMFPHYNRLVLNKFIQEVRSANGGALNMLTYDDVINRVAQLILDHQENTRERINVMGGEMRAQGSTPPPAHVWKNVSEKHRNTALALNIEDPCIICHEEMNSEDVCVLECRHGFHRKCIKLWLKEQSTCPTCREHALLPEDFPMLPGRHRKSHTQAAALN